MTKGFGRALALLCAALALLATAAAAGQEKKATPWASGPSQTARDEGAKASEDGLPGNVVEEMTRYATPGPQHKELAALAGKWTARTRVWENPDANPVEFSGDAEYKMILGGRFLELESH